MKVKYLILGAGPAGLTLANKLLDRGEESFLVLEKENVAGGLCRSIDVDGSELDIGGGHFLDVRRPEVVEYMFKFMPENEWNKFERDSRIFIHDTYIGHPFEANIWQLDENLQKEYLESVKNAGCNTGKEKPEKFTEWINWKLGDAIANNYMLPYNRKMYGEALDELGTYWMEKLPNVSYEDTLRSCEEHRFYGAQPGHAQFYYPKDFGFGEVFRRMAERLGDKLICGVKIEKLSLDDCCVNDGYEAETIITTIPWTAIDDITGLDEQQKNNVDSLKHTSLYVNYFPEKMDTEAQWIYYPDEKLCYHRVLVRHNFLPGAKGYWTETNAVRKEKIGLESEFEYKNEYAYPLNTIGKEEKIASLLEYAKERNVIGLGRWGEWQHYNMDLVVMKAMELSNKI